MLELALAEVRRERNADLEYARLLLRRALSDVARPPFFGGSSTGTSGATVDAGANCRELRVLAFWHIDTKFIRGAR
jgi:hypothetical protein